MNDEERLDAVEDEALNQEDLENQDTEMTDEEIEDEIQEDNEEKIEDEIEQPFYASNEDFDELRDVLIELDYRLLLINDNLVVIGRLNGPDIEVMVKDGEDNYKFVKAPSTLNELKKIEDVFYLSPDMTDEEKEEFTDKLANQESVMSYLMNLLPEKTREEIEANKEEPEDVTDDSLEDIDLENNDTTEVEEEEDEDEIDR